MIFVTGGTGLLGSHLLFQLAQQDVSIKAIYRNKEKIKTVQKVFEYYAPENHTELFSKINWVFCDVLDIVSLEEEMEGATIVYHCAALVSFHRRDFYKMMKINREGTANVVNTALLKGVKKLGYVSSTAAIGGEDKIVTEVTKWKQSPETSGYSISKYSAEKEVWRGVEEGLDAVIVNPCLIVGSGNWEESSMTIFNTIDKGLKFYTPGANAFVDARDVASILVQLVDSTIKNERFLCIGENVSFKAMFDLIANQLGKKAPSIKVAKFLMSITWIVAGLVSRITGKRPAITKETARSSFNTTVYDPSKIKQALNFQFRTLEETVENAVKGRVR